MKNLFFGVSERLMTVVLGTVLVSSLCIFQSCKKENENLMTEIKTLPAKKKVIPQKEEKKEILPKKEEKLDKRTIYLTFDDGPNRGTEKLLKVLHERKVPSTFFVVGKHVNDSKTQKEMMDTLKKDTLIEIANHSYTHANHKYRKFYENPERVLADFDRTKDSLDLTSNIARTPGRNIWRTPNVNATDIKKSKKSADYLVLNGYKLVGWDLEWRHDKNMKLEENHEVMLKRVDSVFFNDLEKTSRHLVLLTHDQYIRDEKSAKELNLFIEKLQKSHRFTFKKISEYPNIYKVLD